MNPADNTVIEALRGTRLAAELDAEQCAVLAKLIKLRDLKDHEVLVHEGVADNHLYVVVKGTLGVVKNAGTADQILLHSLGAGELAGELGFLDGTERFASLLALGDVRVLSLEREQLETLIDTHPRVLYRVMRSIIRTVHLVQRRLSMQATELSNYIFKQHGRY
ncbi:MAG: cyclic nucleotide-binding domain-containing protein [Burkholderiaceae bacterium]